ncbi:MAG: NYN domain-containing protein, partial [Alphaproteobacteria bacterium]
MTNTQTLDRTALFIDGSNFYAAARALGMDIDYAKMRQYFATDAKLLRAYYYTALP